MKKTILFSLMIAALSSLTVSAQPDKSKRPSPPDSVYATTSTGLTISISYSQPSIKGRTIGKEIAPYGKVWRTGANEATVFEINKSASIDGQALAAGKYSLYSLPSESEWSIIFNKTWNQWGTVYKEAEDVLRVKVKPSKAPAFTEKMTFAVAKSGTVTLMWGDTQVSFMVK